MGINTTYFNTINSTTQVGLRVYISYRFYFGYAFHAMEMLGPSWEGCHCFERIQLNMHSFCFSINLIQESCSLFTKCQEDYSRLAIAFCFLLSAFCLIYFLLSSYMMKINMYLVSCFKLGLVFCGLSRTYDLESINKRSFQSTKTKNGELQQSKSYLSINFE